ncbi:hypothetical protein BH23CHL4_BH23CHL4_07540 [soil metagenome]
MGMPPGFRMTEKKSIRSRSFAGGRITVAEGKLIVTRNGEREERPFASKHEERAALKEWFSIEATREARR